MASLLLHVCCAHCGAYPIEHWRSQGHTVSACWYNPNIHPYQEWVHRRDAVRRLCTTLQVPLVESPDYDVAQYFRAVAFHENDRCRHCFALRLNRTACIARDNGFETFTSTLLISPQQKHELIREVGEKAALESGTTFLYADLRKRYSDSRRLTKPMDLYRQQYCGCIYSETERYQIQGES